jgi:hypothetical protein
MYARQLYALKSRNLTDSLADSRWTCEEWSCDPDFCRSLDAAFLASLEFTKARNQFPANPDLTICVRRREGRGSEFMDDVACGDRNGARLRPRPRLHGVYGQLGIKNGAAKSTETILPLLKSELPLQHSALPLQHSALPLQHSRLSMPSTLLAPERCV